MAHGDPKFNDRVTEHVGILTIQDFADRLDNQRASDRCPRCGAEACPHCGKALPHRVDPSPPWHWRNRGVTWRENF